MLIKVTPLSTTATSVRNDSEVPGVEKLDVVKVCPRPLRLVRVRVLSGLKLVQTGHRNSIEESARIVDLVLPIANRRRRWDVRPKPTSALGVTTVAATAGNVVGVLTEGVRVGQPRPVVVVPVGRAIVAAHTTLDGNIWVAISRAVGLCLSQITDTVIVALDAFSGRRVTQSRITLTTRQPELNILLRIAVVQLLTVVDGVTILIVAAVDGLDHIKIWRLIRRVENVGHSAVWQGTIRVVAYVWIRWDNHYLVTTAHIPHEHGC
jgi:hypothetical protein